MSDTQRCLWCSIAHEHQMVNDNERGFPSTYCALALDEARDDDADKIERLKAECKKLREALKSRPKWNHANMCDGNPCWCEADERNARIDAALK